MFNLPSFFRSVFILVVMFSVLFIATKYGGPVKEQASSVLGIRIANDTSELPENLQKDVDASLKDAQAKAMKTDVQDVVDAGSKVNKIIGDYHTLQKEIQKHVDAFFKEKDK